jgi:radical SAM superfamily enzyme YgiQ (UPF0313 family)
VRVLLVSTYELGHQPLHVASPAAALRAAGHDVRTLDTSVEEWDPALVDWAHAVAFSVPMHTAMRLAIRGAEAVKARRPDLPVCFYGLYATVKGPADHVIAGEYEPGLLAWTGDVAVESGTSLTRQRFELPVRASLPSLESYARLVIGPSERLVGYVEATHGCAHRCRHCPVPVVYDGRTRRVPVDVVLDDVAQLARAGAEHITFGDPDFLNRWAHSMQIVSQLHERFPDVTFDITTKVEHVLRYADLVPQLAASGCIFVVSAFECVNDEILRYLDKGHTADEAARATELLRSHGIEVRPSWLPFMPWTSVEDIADILDFVVRNDLVANVDPVQYTIKLLVPKGSLMLSVPEMAPYLGAYDPDKLSYSWRAADERTVSLQERIADLVEDEQARGLQAGVIFCDVRDVVYEAAGRIANDRGAILASSLAPRPRLTEPWFCCAEPTTGQFESVSKQNRGKP